MDQSTTQTLPSQEHPDAKKEGYDLGSDFVYDGDEGLKYGNWINHTDDYTGTGLFPEEVTEINPLNNLPYQRGKGKTWAEPFEIRDNYMLQLVKENMPDRKLNVLELGSGRGGLSRFMAKNLQDLDRFEKLTAINISEKENEMNVQRAKVMGFTDEQFEVVKSDFDSLTYEPETFDLIFSNDAFMHSVDQGKLMENLATLLKKDGIIVFSDIIEDPNIDKTDPWIVDYYQRYKITNLGNRELYDVSLKKAGMKKILSHTDGGQAITRHFGMQLYSATVVNKDNLEGAQGCGKKWLDYKINGLYVWLNLSGRCMIEEGFFVYKKK